MVIKPFKFKNNVEATSTMIDCCFAAKNDILSIRKKSKNFIGTDEAMPYLDNVIYKHIGKDEIQHNSCYLTGNLKTWSASRLFPKEKREGNPVFDAKSEEIKFCKKTVKEFCDGKWKAE